MTQEQKDIIKNRCERNVFSFDDLEVAKRDIISYVRELGFEYPFLPSNIDEGNIEWGNYKEIINKGLQSNYNMARVVRELREHTGSNFAKRTLQYKLKEASVREKQIKKMQEWEYYLFMLLYEQKYGREKMLDYFGLNDIRGELFSCYSISEIAIIFNKNLDKLYEEVKMVKKEGIVSYINSCSFKDYNVALPYKDFNLFMEIVGGEKGHPFCKKVDSLVNKVISLL